MLRPLRSKERAEYLDLTRLGIDEKAHADSRAAESPHGLRNRDNMKHWTVHMDEFFDHYLLGKPRPAWMDTGVSFLDRGKRDVAPMFKGEGK